MMNYNDIKGFRGSCLMNTQERSIARILFQNKVFKADGQAFEDIFTITMNYYCKEFQSIKPWGNIGDRKNDGYIKSEGTYFQVYAPEDIRKSYVDAVNKMKTDFAGLHKQWAPVHKFYFVVNDKYNGVNADCEQTIQEIMATFNLRDAGILTAKDLENKVFELTDDQIFTIVGYFPDPGNLKNIDYSILNEVIEHIMRLPINSDKEYKITLPDLDEKIEFNKLSAITANYLYNGLMKVVYLEEYLENSSNFVADSLRDKLSEVYKKEKENYSGDSLFWEIVDILSPNKQQMYQSIVIIIMSKYFETCDIFEEPIKEDEE